MATYNTIIEPAKTRPCWVNGRRALFHRWTDSARPAKARGEENDPEAKYYQLYSVHALVEYEDGTMARVWPAVLQFADGGEFVEYDWDCLEEMRDALPYTFDDASEEKAAEIVKKSMRNCLNCGYTAKRCLHNCDTCPVDGCRCRDCDGASLWAPKVGSAL